MTHIFDKTVFNLPFYAVMVSAVIAPTGIHCRESSWSRCKARPGPGVRQIKCDVGGLYTRVRYGALLKPLP